MIKLLQFIFILFLFQSCAKNESLEKKIISDETQAAALQFDLRGFNSGSTIGLISDTSFYYKSYWVSCTGGGATNVIFGKYSKTENEIELFPERVIYKSHKKGDQSAQIIKRPFDNKKDKLKTRYYFSKVDEKMFLMGVDRNPRIVFPSFEMSYTKGKKEDELLIEKYRKEGKEFKIRALEVSFYELEMDAEISADDFLRKKKFNGFDFDVAQLPEDVREILVDKMEHL